MNRFVGVLLVLSLGPLVSVAAMQNERLFAQELHNNGARVTTSHSLPSRVWDQACRNALLVPYRQQQVEMLTDAVDLELTLTAGYVEAMIDGYSSYRDEGWLYCSAQSIEVNVAASQAGTAIRKAWQLRETSHRDPMIALLQVALAHPTTYDDAVALVVTTMEPELQIGFLNSNLEPTNLQLEESFESLFTIWVENQQYDIVLELADSCESPKCRQLGVQARQFKEKQDAETLFDLSSYL